MSEAGARKKTRVAILGGGVGAMTAAFELTNPRNPRCDDYDVTVYQMGWRIGGKGASGRNPDDAYRIEEHGLHMWFGSYDNAFRVIRECYEELDRPPDAPLATWDEAFKPASFTVKMEKVDGEWQYWYGHEPTNDETPGEGPRLLSIWEYFSEFLLWLRQQERGAPYLPPSPTGDVPWHPAKGAASFLDRLGGWISTAIVYGVTWILLRVHFLARVVNALGGLLVALMRPLMWFKWVRSRRDMKTDGAKRHSWIMANLIYGTLRGFVKHDVIRNGFSVIDDYDYRDWVSRYVYPDDGWAVNSGFMLSLYDGCFAYEDGDNQIPEGERFSPKANMSAAVVAYCGIRWYLSYKGAWIFKMQAGMGDVVFGPLYEVLRRRGVKFEFFHRVMAIEAAEDGSTVERIRVQRQVDVKPDAEGRREYRPLITVKGLPCWPDRPLYDQLEQGEEIREKGIDLESYVGWEGVGEKTLENGRDFDVVVCGISIGGLPYVAEDLIGKSPKWKASVDGVKTV
ncbi:MAG: NAD(P)-binding protein, partial [Thermoanaerobaculia bacterium]|nr:NAD(P)-binding protein [Thermoanaerobaculia bacterium]